MYLQPAATCTSAAPPTLNQVDGVELTHPTNGVLRLACPKKSKTRYLLWLKLSTSAAELLQPAAADRLVTEMEAYGQQWHEMYPGALPDYKEAAAREENARATAEAEAAVMNRSPAGKRETVRAAVAAATNRFKFSPKTTGLFNADGQPITDISQERLRNKEVYIGCGNAETFICLYGGATLGLAAFVLSVQPHPGGLIRQAVVIESAAALRAKLPSALAVKQRFFEYSKRILITSSPVIADPERKGGHPLAVLTGTAALDAAAMLRGAQSLCKPVLPEPAAAEEPEDFSPALAMDDLFSNIDQIAAAEAAAMASAAAAAPPVTKTPATSAPAAAAGASAPASSYLAAAAAGRHASGGRGGAARGGGRARGSARGGARGSRQAPAPAADGTATTAEAAAHQSSGRARDRALRESAAAAQSERGSGMLIDAHAPAGGQGAAGGEL